MKIIIIKKVTLHYIILRHAGDNAPVIHDFQCILQLSRWSFVYSFGTFKKCSSLFSDVCSISMRTYRPPQMPNGSGTSIIQSYSNLKFIFHRGIHSIIYILKVESKSFDSISLHDSVCVTNQISQTRIKLKTNIFSLTKIYYLKFELYSGQCEPTLSICWQLQWLNYRGKKNTIKNLTKR